MGNSKLFDVYHGTNYPHRILQSVTLEQLQVYCKEHEMTHQAHRDTQRGGRYWDAFVIAAYQQAVTHGQSITGALVAKTDLQR